MWWEGAVLDFIWYLNKCLLYFFALSAYPLEISALKILFNYIINAGVTLHKIEPWFYLQFCYNFIPFNTVLQNHYLVQRPLDKQKFAFGFIHSIS